MVVGEGVRLEQIMEHQGKVLIGRFFGQQILEKPLNECMCLFLHLIIGDSLKFLIMVRVWIGFVFKSTTNSLKNLR